MIEAVENGARRGDGSWRLGVWGVPVLLYAIPVVAKLTVPGMLWTAEDFVAWAVMLLVAAGLCELVMRISASTAYRIAAGLAVMGLFLLVWINLAVGIIGDEDNPANLMYAGVIALGFGGACVARGKPRDMSNTMFAVAAVQLLVGAIAVIARWGLGNPIWPMDVIGCTGIFTVIWLASAWLFRMAARQ